MNAIHSAETCDAETIAHAFGDRREPLLEHTVGDALRHSAAQWGSRPALVDGSELKAQRRRWTFADLLRDAEQVAHALRRHFGEGEHVAVWAPNSPEWILLEFGAALAGLTLVTVNPAYQASELTYVLGQSEAVGLFVVPEYRGRDMIAVVDEVSRGFRICARSSRWRTGAILSRRRNEARSICRR